MQGEWKAFFKRVIYQLSLFQEKNRSNWWNVLGRGVGNVFTVTSRPIEFSVSMVEFYHTIKVIYDVMKIIQACVWMCLHRRAEVKPSQVCEYYYFFVYDNRSQTNNSKVGIFDGNIIIQHALSSYCLRHHMQHTQHNIVLLNLMKYIVQIYLRVQEGQLRLIPRAKADIYFKD